MEIVITTGILAIVCFLIGFKLGLVSKGTPETKIIELPNPMEKYREKKEKELIKKEQEELQINLENINNYDGTDRGQKNF